ncbi:MAG: YdiU family protein [Gammaproteobacteria bacterium]|nr:YdiU family protein [Gammaproteobacteria bacterium]MBQ0838531.1 YdiU family protein [Gammaproteobacteria bacterium]
MDRKTMAVFDSSPLQSSYRQIGEQFYTDQLPTPVGKPALIRVNPALAEQLNLSLSELQSPEALQVFAGNSVPPTSTPIATVYAAHQFGGWNPQLGDGRAILLGEVIGKDQQRYDIQLKGAGQTPYSRRGDGRSALGPVLREYIVSEAMAALGVPTTRALAAVTTGDRVVRESYLPGAILTRVASSHIRIGTFQFFSAQGDVDSVKTLADYVIERHYKAAVEASDEDSYSALLTCVMQAQARLIARWMAIGFIHGVMNTDNMLVCGETVDYGPCAFMDAYNPNKVFSSIDSHGRYAYAKQAEIGHWNISWLAQALLPLMDASQEVAIKKAEKILNAFSPVFTQTYQQLLAEKMGFASAGAEVNQLSVDLLQLMAAEATDFTLTFRGLSDYLAPEAERYFLNKLVSLPETFQAWVARWQAELARQNVAPQTAHQLMLKTNPSYIPRNHIIAAAIEQATGEEDFSLFHQMVDVLAKPFEYSEENASFAIAPKPEEEVLHTFCGT